MMISVSCQLLLKQIYIRYINGCIYVFQPGSHRSTWRVGLVLTAHKCDQLNITIKNEVIIVILLLLHF